MAFLSLNNVVVPVASGNSTREYVLAGGMQQSFAGTYHADLRSYKRKWTFRTIPMPPLRAQTLRGMLTGHQIYYQFDSSLYSSAGVGTSTQAGTNIRLNVAPVTPYNVVDEHGTSEAKVGAGSLTVQRSITNSLTAAQASATATTGMTAIGTGVLTIDSGTYLEGTTSLKIAATASGDGVEITNSVTATTSNTVWASFYVTGTAGVQVQAIIYDHQHAGNIATTTVTLTGSTWQRVVVSGVPVINSTNVSIKILVNHVSTNVWVDAIMLEAETSSPSSSVYAGSWVAGGTTQAAGSLAYSSSVLSARAKGVTFNAWVTAPPQLQNEYLFALTNSPDTQQAIVLYFKLTAWQVLVVDRTGTGSVSLAPSYTWDNSWHMVTLVLNLAPSAGEHSLYLYVDGVVQATADMAASALPTLSEMSLIQIGNLDALKWWGGRIDDVQVLPFPVDSTWITGTYGLPAFDNQNYPGDIATFGAGYNSLTYPDGVPAPTPYLYASGDSINAAAALVMGQVTKETIAGYYDQSAGAWRQDGHVIDFTLTEV